MANVSNPYEINTENNLVVTSYINNHEVFGYEYRLSTDLIYDEMIERPEIIVDPDDFYVEIPASMVESFDDATGKGYKTRIDIGNFLFKYAVNGWGFLVTVDNGKWGFTSNTISAQQLIDNDDFTYNIYLFFEFSNITPVIYLYYTLDNIAICFDSQITEEQGDVNYGIIIRPVEPGDNISYGDPNAITTAKIGNEIKFDISNPSNYNLNFYIVDKYNTEYVFIEADSYDPITGRVKFTLTADYIKYIKDFTLYFLCEAYY